MRYSYWMKMTSLCYFEAVPKLEAVVGELVEDGTRGATSVAVLPRRLPDSRAEQVTAYCTVSVSLTDWTRLPELELKVPVTVKL